MLRREWNSRLSDSESGALAAVTGVNVRLCVLNVVRAKRFDHAIEHSYVRERVLPERKLLTEALKRGIGAVTVEDVAREMQIVPLSAANSMAARWRRRKKCLPGVKAA